ncbi:MAG: glycoside hydrolase family 36 protein [Candidatus Sericytochromatia bacterium]|nr:glycoside hydrolase family 36 protein [Candidatus Sericytochromatia bacterium]
MKPTDSLIHWACPSGGEGLELRSSEGESLLSGVQARVRLSDGSEWRCSPQQVIHTASGGLRWLSSPGDIRRPSGDLQLTWEIKHHPHGLKIQLQLKNLSTNVLRVASYAPLIGTCSAGHPQEPLVLQAGWQSWSYATPLMPVSWQRDLPGGPIAGPWQLTPTPGAFVSPGHTVIQFGEQRPVLLGFASAERGLGSVSLAAQGPDWRINAGWEAEDYALAPGETLTCEPLLVFLAETPETLLERYAFAVRAQTANEQRGRAPQSGSPPKTGWCSWYAHGAQIDERRLAHTLVTLRERAPQLELILVDDGWQADIGDWDAWNHGFPSGMAALANRIRQHGFTPGLWLAPFLTSESSDTFRRHPEWILRDPAGSPTLACHNWGQRCYALDLSRPEVRAHLTATLRTIVRSWGFEFLKLDFLYAGALPGQPWKTNESSVTRYRKGLESLRTAVPEAYMLGCGAPLLPSVGLVDAMRIGPDIAPHWEDPEPTGSAPAMENAMRSTLARLWCHPHWWTNDPDCLLLNPQGSNLSQAARESWTRVVALSGGLQLFSDDVSALSEAAFQSLNELGNRRFTPQGASKPNANGVACVIEAREHGPSVEGRPWLMLLNPNATPAEVEPPIAPAHETRATISPNAEQHGALWIDGQARPVARLPAFGSAMYRMSLPGTDSTRGFFKGAKPSQPITRGTPKKNPRQRRGPGD